MKKHIRRLPLLLLALVLLLTLPSPAPARAALEPDPVMRIGLYYGDNALAAANLQNAVGAGYRMGYLDGDRRFVEIGRINPQKITMLKNRNMYLKNGEYTESDSSGAVAIGCYHIDTGQVFSGFSAAQSSANDLRARGLKAFPVYSVGAYRVRVGAYVSSAAATAAIPASGLSGATAVTGSAYCVSVTTTENGDIVFQFDGGADRWLAVWPSLGEVTDPVTWFKGYQYRGGFEYRRMSGNNMTVTNWVHLQDYIKGVIPYEMSPSWHIEALKAQALCAKSYAMTQQNKHRSAGFDLCNTTDCQVYHGTNSATANSDRAVDETYGLFVYYNNAPAQTVYHSSDGGSTESSQNVWGSNIPYLQAVTDTYENVNHNWQTTYTNSDITQILKDKGVNVGSVVNAYIDQFTPAGNVYRLVITDSAGKTYSYEGEKARTILNAPSRGKNIYSQRYTMTGGAGVSGSGLTIAGPDGTVGKSGTDGLYVATGKGVVSLSVPTSELRIQSKDGVSTLPGGAIASSGTSSSGTYVVNGRGRGHNVGMSQYGAKAMAELGFRAEEIIKFYFKGVSVS